MRYFNRNYYRVAIDQETIGRAIKAGIDNSEGVKKIQTLKEYIVKKIFSSILKIDDPKQDDGKSSLTEDTTGINTLNTILELIETPQSRESLGKRKGYVGDFNNFIHIMNKHVGKTDMHLNNLYYDRLVSKKDKQEILTYFKIFEDKIPENSKSRVLEFDEDIFNSYLLEGENSNDIEGENINNIEYFYEEDFNGNKNYFSINTLLNYIDTFGIEMGLPKINIESIDETIKKKYFPSINRKVKYHMYKTILEKMRDKQEILIYDFTDYESIEGEKKHQRQSGFIAEKIVELQFRELANLGNYDISIVKPSIGEDQQNKVDLYIILEDKKTGIKVKEELQITLKKDLTLKEEQIKKRNEFLKEEGNFTESQLINFTMNDLSKKIHAWQYFNRPIGKLSDTLDENEKAIIRVTFKRLVSDLEMKNEEIKEQKNRKPSSKINQSDRGSKK